jgi:deazaflavin-dependent oxidoreductase (nitroreductase family)
MPSDLFFRGLNTVHRTVMKLSGGRLGWDVANMPVLELTTTGRKTGRPHTVVLTSPVRDGDAIVVVASRGGDNHHPAWFLNLRDNPDVDVAIGREPKRSMRARVADPDERARLWPQVVARYKGYGDYQTRTDREIPLVLLESRR